MATTLPWLEVAVGALLLLGLWPTPALLTAALLFAAFALAAAVNLLRGRRIRCGCRGVDTPISWRLVGTNVLLALTALAAADTGPTPVLTALIGRAPQLAATDAFAAVLALALLAVTSRLVAAWSITADAMGHARHQHPPMPAARP